MLVLLFNRWRTVSKLLRSLGLLSSPLQVGKVPPKNRLCLSIAFSASTRPPIPLFFPFISLSSSFPLAAQQEQYFCLFWFFLVFTGFMSFLNWCLFLPVDGSIQFCFSVVLLYPAWRNLASCPFCKACVLFSLEVIMEEDQGRHWWAIRGLPQKHLGRLRSLTLLLKWIYFI